MADDSHLGNKGEKNPESDLWCLLLRSLSTGSALAGKVEEEKEIHLVAMQNFRCQWHIEDETVRCREGRD